MGGAGDWEALETGRRWRLVVAGEWQALEGKGGCQFWLLSNIDSVPRSTPFLGDLGAGEWQSLEKSRRQRNLGGLEKCSRQRDLGAKCRPETSTISPQLLLEPTS